VFDGEHLLVSSFFNGSMMLGLSDDPPAARVLWRGQSDSEIDTDGLHALITTPVIDAMHVYGICSYGQLRALEVSSGVRVWESQQAVGEKARWASGFIVRQGKRYFINTDRGDLVIARLTPEGYEEIDRTRLIEPTSSGGGRRELKAVHWSHPAYANGHIIVRNDREIVRASLLSSTRAEQDHAPK
jgi:outer membrane protein assembly factor BamB